MGAAPDALAFARHRQFEGRLAYDTDSLVIERTKRVRECVHRAGEQQLERLLALFDLLPLNLTRLLRQQQMLDRVRADVVAFAASQRDDLAPAHPLPRHVRSWRESTPSEERADRFVPHANRFADERAVDRRMRVEPLFRRGCRECLDAIWKIDLQRGRQRRRSNEDAFERVPPEFPIVVDAAARSDVAGTANSVRIGVPAKLSDSRHRKVAAAAWSGGCRRVRPRRLFQGHRVITRRRGHLRELRRGIDRPYIRFGAATR